MSLSVAIFEPEAEGHHMVYVGLIARALIERGHQVTLVTTTRAQQHPAYETVQRDLEGRLAVRLMPDTQTPDDASDLRRIRDQFRRRGDYNMGFKQLASELKPDVCFMMNLDRADLPLALLGSPFGQMPFAGFLMGRQFHCPKVGVKIEGLRRRDKIAEPVFYRLLCIKSLRKVISVDDTLVTFAKKTRPVGWEKVVHVADAAYINLSAFTGDAREFLGLPKGFLLLAYGSLSLRKGVEELLNGAGESAILVLAGKQDEEVCQLLQTPVAQRLREQGRLLEINRFIDSQTEAALFKAADAVWVGYRHWYGMSGVLVQAAAAGKPVLAMDEGLVGHLVNSHELGLAVRITDAEAVQSGITQLMENPKDYGANGLRFAENRTPQSFATEVSKIIESCV